MEISFQTRKTPHEHLPLLRTAAPGSGGSFSAVLQSQERATAAWRRQQIQAIDEAAERLVQSRNLEAVHRYKALISQFVESVVREGYVVDALPSRNRRSRKQRVLLILRELDEALLGLTTEVLDKERERLHLLQLLDEIRGLILNLYT